MSKTKKRSKHQSESESSSSSSESDERHKKAKSSKSLRDDKPKEDKPSQSIWDSPKRKHSQSSSRHDDKRRERKRSHDGDKGETSRYRGRDDNRRDDSYRRRSPDRRDDRRKQSPQERRRGDSRDRRNDRQDDDRRRRSSSRDKKPFNDRRGGGGGSFKQRRFNNKEEDEGNFEWGKRDPKQEQNEEPTEKDKPNFGLSGKLTEETNKVNGIVIKYAEPPEAKQPKRRWRFYPFKGETALPTLYIHRQSAYLIGRDRKICDLSVDHPSCSKQHAALQYRLVPYEREDGSTGKRVRPYIIDLESANGTFVNNKKIDSKKYVELLEKDVVKFGFSSREYVLLHEASKDEVEDDEVADDDESAAK